MRDDNPGGIVGLWRVVGNGHTVTQSVSQPCTEPYALPHTLPYASPSASGLILWGDSRTEGIGDVAPFIFPAFVATALPGVMVTGAGRSGQTAAQIVAREGGEPTRLTLAGNAIPSSGSVEVTQASVDLFFYAGDANAQGSYAGTLGGIHGIYASDGTGGRSFTRSDAGGMVALSPATPFATDLGEQSRDAVMFLCAGRNDIDVDDPAETVRLTAAAVADLSGVSPRYMVAGVMPDLNAKAGSSQRQPYDALNALLLARHGSAYLDLVTPPTPEEMASIGYAPDADDRADIAAGVFPRGMFQDSIHLLRTGQMIWANRVADRYRERGWT